MYQVLLVSDRVTTSTETILNTELYKVWDLRCTYVTRHNLCVLAYGFLSDGASLRHNFSVCGHYLYKDLTGGTSIVPSTSGVDPDN